MKHRVMHPGYQKMHPVSHVSVSIQQISSRDIFTTDIFQWPYIGKVNEAYASTNAVDFDGQMLKHNDQCTGLEYMREILFYLAHQGLYNIDSAKVFNLLSTANTWRNTCRAHHLYLQQCQEKPFFRHVLQQIHHMREPHVCRVCRSVKLTSLWNAWEDVGCSEFWQQFWAQIEEEWGHEVSGPVLRCHQNVLTDSILIKFQNGLLYYCEWFHCTTSAERLEHDCKVAYTNANQGIMPESHNIWVQYMESDLPNNIQGLDPSFCVVHFGCTPLNAILHFQKDQPNRKTVLTFSKRCKKTQQWISCSQAEKDLVVIPT